MSGREPVRPASVVLTDEQKRRQRARVIATALLLVALVVMFYLVTLAKLGPTVVTGRPL